MVWMLLPAGIFAADDIMKRKAESWKEEEPPRKVFGGRIILQKLHNRGAAFSFMQERPKVLTYMTATVTAGIIAGYVWIGKEKKMLLLKTGAGMILGGALSNLRDRICRG